MLITDNNIEAVKRFEDRYFDLILADFDYGFGKISRNKWNGQDLAICSDLIRILKDRGVIVTFSSGRFSFELYSQMAKYYRYTTIWDKGRVTGHLNAKRMPMLRHENLMIFAKGEHTYNPQKMKGAKPHSLGKAKGKNYAGDAIYNPHNRVMATDMKYPQSIIHFPTINPTLKRWPTEKPQALYEYLIKTYSNKGGTVLDPACGSGRSLCAAKVLGRIGVGIDIDPEAIKITKRSLEEILW